MRQPNLFSSNSASGPAMTRENGAATESPSQPPRRRRSRRWVSVLFAAEFLLSIMVRIFIGVIVLVVPWSPLWDNNHLLLSYPRVATALSFGAIRGIISGLGLLNLWIAIDDTLHRSERHT